ncbi:MAG TPA: RHS repeat-associated core domain-containing protein [Polyangiaceae bacterium]|nr:RHS repeat-associated core domain-containing protein [Polyangiaceae bacterium]
MGSPRVIVSVGGPSVIVQRIDYDEFGNRSVPTDSGAFAAVAQPFGFAGGLYDADTGLVHFGARDYDPSTGRWISKDPILFDGGSANLYAYVDNDPVNRIDPTGHFPFILVGICAAGGCEAAATAAAAAAIFVGSAAGAAALIHRITADEPANDNAIPDVCAPDEPLDDDCQQQWEDAYADCERYFKFPKVYKGLTGGYSNAYDCARGHVDERCKGNKVIK